MSEQRPDPDKLLAEVQQAEQRVARGRLKIFFGMAAGVGKTYAMLEAARARQAEGLDVVVGWVETHGRAETEALTVGLERLPPRQVTYRGVTLAEFDLDAALARHPQLIIVDELAHTNAPGSRHAKRWQDIEELLSVGIDVYTTLNVQHIESLNDVVAQITGIVVRETVPDQVIDQADEIELIDLSPDELLQRLREGKVYLPQQAAHALRHFFRKGNLIALRELALRHIADRVDLQMQDYMRDHAIPHTWPTTERIMVGVGTGPGAARLVRAARRMASTLRAQWLVAYVETPARHSPAERERVMRTLRLAEQLGGESVTLTGHDVATTLVTYARRRNVTKLILGKPRAPHWRELVRASVASRVLRCSGDIDVYLIAEQEDEEAPPGRFGVRPSSGASAYWRALAVVALCTLLVAAVDRWYPAIADANLVMAYLLGVTFVATRYGRGPSILASLVSVLAFDFFFVAPHLSFAVSDTQYLITFAVMLLVALVISTLTVRVRRQAQAAIERAERTAALYALSRELARVRGQASMIEAAVRHISTTFDARVAILLNDEQGHLELQAVGDPTLVREPSELGVAQWVAQHGEVAGLGTQTLGGAHALYLPLRAAQRVLGVVAVCPRIAWRLFEPEQYHLLETFIHLTASALERARLAVEAEQARVQIETERQRSSLLSAISHDLCTPLATITGAATSLLDTQTILDQATRRDLLQAIAEEAERLTRLVRNLLDITKLESGAITVRKEWQPLEEVIGAALTRLSTALQGRTVLVDVPATLPLVPIDSVLIEQVLLNLLENALKYTPSEAPITIRARSQERSILVEVADQGPGLPPGAETRVFEKFYRGDPHQPGRGAGLGLAICAAIVRAHGGTISAISQPGGGARFQFTLPLDGTPPPLIATPDEPGGTATT